MCLVNKIKLITKKLIELVKRRTKSKNKNNIIHVIYTLLRSSNYILYIHNLYIIKVLNVEFKNKMKKLHLTF